LSFGGNLAARRFGTFATLSANNGLMQRSKQHRYSITSSARTNSVGGTVGLSALLRSGWERTDRRLSPSSFFAK
jgi:hypothetical protein